MNSKLWHWHPSLYHLISCSLELIFKIKKKNPVTIQLVPTHFERVTSLKGTSCFPTGNWARDFSWQPRMLRMIEQHLQRIKGSMLWLKNFIPSNIYPVANTTCGNPTKFQDSSGDNVTAPQCILLRCCRHSLMVNHKDGTLSRLAFQKSRFPT